MMDEIKDSFFTAAEDTCILLVAIYARILSGRARELR